VVDAVGFDVGVSSFVLFLDFDFCGFLAEASGAFDSLGAPADFVSETSAFALVPFGFDLGIVVADSSLWSFDGGLSFRVAFGETVVGSIFTPPNNPFFAAATFDG